MKLMNYLSENIDGIKNILLLAGFENITHNSKRFSFAFDSKGGSGSCILDIKSLLFNRFSTSEGGTIIDAIMLKMGFDFKNAKRWIENKIGVEALRSEIGNSFCRFSDSVNKIESVTPSKNELAKFRQCVSDRFLDDSISAFTQIMFDVKYNPFYERVVTLWKDVKGNIVGYNSRANFEFDSKYKSKYLTSHGFQKGSYLFGLDHNIEYIKEEKSVCLVEAEKSVMQSYDFGFRQILGLGSADITKRQCNILKDLGVEKIFIMLDESTNLLHYEKLYDRISKEFDFRIFILHDYSKFKSGSKDSPTDNGKDFFEDCFFNRTGELKEED